MVAKEPPKIDSSGRGTGTGRLLAVDLGAKRVGVAVCDELRLAVRALEPIERRSWKDLLRRVTEQIKSLEAAGLVIGLPLNLDGSEGSAAAEARRIAENFRRSLGVPVYLQDERLTTEEAKSRMHTAGRHRDVAGQLDSESAAIILQDFISEHR